MDLQRDRGELSMAKNVNSRKRMEALVNGQAVDKIPVALWRHFPVDDQSPDKLAAATIHFQQSYDFDFVKVSPSSSFCLNDWGAKDEWCNNTEGTRDYLAPVIKDAESWKNLPVLDPKKGVLGGQLECLKKVRDSIGHKTPIIQTIFSPLSQAKNLVGKTNLNVHMRAYPEALKTGLETITETTAAFITECIKLGIDGVFFAVQHASYDLLTLGEFEDFEKTYDRKLFPLVNEFWMNVAHIHGKNIMAEAVLDYPMQIFNWHDCDIYPDLAKGQKLFNKITCGGLGRINTMLLGNDDLIKAEISDAVQQTGGKQFVLGTGCVLPQTVPYGNIKTAVDFVRSIAVD